MRYFLAMMTVCGLAVAGYAGENEEPAEIVIVEEPSEAGDDVAVGIDQQNRLSHAAKKGDCGCKGK